MGEETTKTSAKNTRKQPHVLVFPYPAQGHINPMLQFSKRLVPKGVKATLVSTISLSTTTHLDPRSPISIETVSDGFDEGGIASAESPDVYLERFSEVGSRTLAELIERLERSGDKVDAVVYDGFLPWVLDVAKSFGIVGVLFFTQSGGVNNIYYHVHRNLLSLPFPEGTKVSVPGVPPLEPSETPSFVHIYGSYPAFLDMVIGQFKNIEKADWVLFNTFYDLEPEVLDWMSRLWRVRTIGPTLPSMYLDKRLEDDKHYGINLFQPKHSECINWLDSKPKGSVAYVSFGSMADLGPEQMEELAWGLAESSINFLWVVRATEHGKLPKEFDTNKSCPERGLVVTWSPQLEVLAHEAIGCFVSHCGFNSVLEALSLGVPIVAMPQWTDQATNAKYIEDVWRTGLRTKRDEDGIVRRGSVVSCIKEVMEGERGEEIKRNAMKWKNLAIEASSEGGSSDKNIDEFVAELKLSL